MSMLSEMSTITIVAAVITLAGCGGQGDSENSSAKSMGARHVAEGPNLGIDITQADIVAWDIAIGPGGANRPPGGATAADGKDLFIEQCASCHGMDGEGGVADKLVGGIGSLASDQPVKTVGSFWPYAPTLFDFIRRSMPLNTPQSLSDNQVYALSAYILSMNGIVAEDQRIDAESLPEVEMPNRGAFFQVYPGRLE